MPGIFHSNGINPEAEVKIITCTSIEINIEKCVSDSVEAYSNTPRSVLCRKHEPPPSSESKPNVLKNLGSGLGSSKLAHGYQGNDAWVTY